MAPKKGSGKKAAAAASAAVAGATTTAVDLLGGAVAALNSGQPFMASEASMAHLVADPRGPLVEFNANMKDGAGNIAYRATALGMQIWTADQAAKSAPVAAAPAWGTPVAQPNPPVPQTPAAPAAGAKSFAFAVGVPLPAPRRGGRGSTVYGFEQMNVGASFFIAKTAENPNPAKRIASTVSSASARLEPKKFIVRSVVTDAAMAQAWNVAVGTPGAGVWRTE